MVMVKLIQSGFRYFKPQFPNLCMRDNIYLSQKISVRIS